MSHSEKLDEIEQTLLSTGQQWLSGGSAPGDEDGEALGAMGGVCPSTDSHPNAYTWFAMVSKFSKWSAHIKKVEAQAPAPKQ